MNSSNVRPFRCGIVLAGGDGRRLQPFISRFLGYNLPKQYMSFIGSRSMLEHTYNRAERLIPSERIFTVVANEHLAHLAVQRQIGKRPPNTLVIQPQNKETGPGLLLPLIHLYKQYPNAIVALFPSDHFIIQEELFCAYVQLAFETVERSPARIVFLGVKPTDPEPEYGYIIPKNGGHNPSSSIQNVDIFIEKPERSVAEHLRTQGALWNTMVMVFRTEIILHLVKLAAPQLYHAFQQIFRALGSRHEETITKEVYEQIETVNFSKDLLEGIDAHSRNQFVVVPMNGVFWSDWGTEKRIISVLQEYDCPKRLLKYNESERRDKSMALEPSSYSLQNLHA